MDDDNGMMVVNWCSSKAGHQKAEQGWTKNDCSNDRFGFASYQTIQAWLKRKIAAVITTGPSETKRDWLRREGLPRIHKHPRASSPIEYWHDYLLEFAPHDIVLAHD